MTRDIGSSAISGSPLQEAFPQARRKSTLAPSPARCADAARTRGEPIAASAAPYSRYLLLEAPGLGGHRFAATVKLLPTGDMFGWLDQRSAVTAVERFDAGQFLLAHYRGRSGQPQPVQAALHAAAVILGDSRRLAFRLAGIERMPDAQGGADRWDVRVSHRAERGREVTYLVTMTFLLSRYPRLCLAKASRNCKLWLSDRPRRPLPKHW
jgi:hypothetical protein